MDWLKNTKPDLPKRCESDGRGFAGKNVDQGSGLVVFAVQRGATRHGSFAVYRGSQKAGRVWPLAAECGMTASPFFLTANGR